MPERITETRNEQKREIDKIYIQNIRRLLLNYVVKLKKCKCND